MRYSGIIEVDGLPTRPKLKNAAHIQPEDASATPTPDENAHEREFGGKFENDQAFALAAASLRQALQDMPELTEASKHIMFEETKEGLNINIVDQDGRSMFPEGSKEPYERTRSDHRENCRPAEGDAVPDFNHRPHLGVAGRRRSPVMGRGTFRSIAPTRCAQILEEQGYPSTNIYEVAGKADTDPLFPDDPYMAANRRVTITLMHEAPPVPPDLNPERQHAAGATRRRYCKPLIDYR